MKFLAVLLVVIAVSHAKIAVGESLVRVAHASPDAPAVDVYVDDKLVSFFFFFFVRLRWYFLFFDFIARHFPTLATNNLPATPLCHMASTTLK